MPISPDHLSGAVAFDGSLMFTANSPEMSLSTAATNQGKMVAPCDGTIVAVIANLVQAPGSAAAKLQIGDGAGVNTFGEYSFATTAALGVIDLDVSALTTAVVTKGAVIEFNTDGAATSTGLVAVTIVVSPNA